MINRYIYKTILRKINLSKKELLLLKKKLNKNTICYGPFVKGKKMCPNTTALGIKLKRKFKNNEIVSNYFRKIGINKNYLWVFYITFDIPSMISQSIFQNNLKELKKAVDELSNTNT